MRKLLITDVGPITGTATIEYERYCILIGPQSNGKSTIAKILSTCLWLEKEACTTLNESVVTDGMTFKELVENFHRMHNYIHSDSSVIEYTSPYISIVYNKGDFKMSFNDNLSYTRTKISYIPSDRNVVTMRDIEKRDLEPTNFRSFLFDWLETNRNYDVNHKAPILNLDMKYYYDDNARERMDMLTHENGITYAIPLYDASSGMQSLVPMTVLMHYLVSGYFSNYARKTSFEQEKKKKNLAWAITRKITEKYFPDQTSDDTYKDVYNREIKLKADENDPDAVARTVEMKRLYNNLVYPQSISFIVEEPEQNLYPETQVSLLFDIIRLCNAEHPSSVFITTHSPYILAAANILLFAGKLKASGVDDRSVEESIFADVVMSQGDFSAYTVSGGTCQSLLDEETNLIRENVLDSASEYNAELFDRLYRIYIQSLQQS